MWDFQEPRRRVPSSKSATGTCLFTGLCERRSLATGPQIAASSADVLGHEEGRGQDETTADHEGLVPIRVA